MFSCEDGEVDIVPQDEMGHHLLAPIPTRSGTRASVLKPEQDTSFVATPPRRCQIGRTGWTVAACVR